MLRHRILAAVPLFLLIYAALWLDARHGVGWGLAAVMAILTPAALWEFYGMVRVQGGKPFAVFGCVMCFLLVFAMELWCLEKWHGLPRARPDVMSTLVAAIVLGVFAIQTLSRGAEQAVANISSTLLGLIYVWFLPSFLIKMRHLGMRHGWAYDGVEFVFVCLTVAKVSDVGGYLIGGRFGRHKLCPSLSPKKTWEGAIGGVALSMGLISMYVRFAPLAAVATLGWPKILALGALLGVSSLLGDLMESSLKRDSRVKDAGKAVPGFGGVLDVLDSLMVSAPVMYFFLLFAGARQGWSP